MNLEDLRSWVGRTETRSDDVSAMQVSGLIATLDRDDPAPELGTELPPLWHWMNLVPIAPQSQLGPDGHPRRGGFLPPVPLPRRMWAGGRLLFHHPLRIGDRITRESLIKDVEVKHGRSGTLVIVTVRHEIRNARGVALSEEHDIVYRDAPQAGAAPAGGTPAPQDAGFSRTITPDPVLLFRYSALTFNGHRIHYDRSYVTQEEGYPGLIVHGPLVATLLLDLLRRQHPQARIKSFDFKAVRPLFDIHPFSVHGRIVGDGRAELWAQDHEQWLTMQAHAEFE